MGKLTRLAIGLVLVVAATAAQAQNYPTRPIKLIVAIAAGSVTDVIARKAGQELSQQLGQPIIIENRGTAAGIIAAEACARAKPDGYTLCLLHSDAMSYNPLHYTKLPYDPARDLVPISRLFFVNEILCVPTALGVNSVADLKALAVAKPDSLNFATLGEGSLPDLFLKWLNNKWGTKIVGVPYAGGGPAAQAIAGNQVQMTRFGVGNFLGLIRAGNVKALAVSTAKRSPLLPNVPTFDEAGLPGYPGQIWWGIVAPTGISPALVSKINGAFVKLFTEPSFVAYLDTQSVTAAPDSPQEFAKFLVEDRKAAETLVKLANAKRQDYKAH